MNEIQAQEPNAVPKKPLSTSVWVNTTYFAEGLPYMIVRALSAVFFTDMGAKERYIGYLNFLGIPWNLKFLWSPFIDTISTKRKWLVLLQIAIALMTLAIALICYFAPATGDASNLLALIAVMFVGMAFLSATNDVAIDGYYQEGLTDKRDQAAYSGYRVMAYRFSIIFARSGLVALAAWAAAGVAGDNKFLAWSYAFGAGALTMLALAIFHALRLPRFEREDRETMPPSVMLKSFGRSFVSYLQQERIALILVFIVFYKLGDEILFSMFTPFLMRELAVTKAQYSWIGGFVGAGGAIAGAMMGAWWIKRKGLEKAIWPLTLLMNVNIWAYAWLAYAKPDATTTLGISTIAIIHGYEQWAAGLGNAVLVIYLLRTCKPEYKAAHYAIGSAIMSLGGTLFGGFGGAMVEQVGYLNLFAIAFVASIPSMILLFWLPLKEQAAT